MPTVLESLTNFLTAKRETHNAPELLDLWTPDMETQVNVSAGEGEPVPGRRHTWTDGLHEWWNIRVPRNANSDPEVHDYPMEWPLDLHVESIGCTGWDWRNRCSRWVGFDFDSITGHAAGIGVSADDLANVAEAAKALPFVEVRKSTGGAGLHLYVHLDSIPTANHTEHAALARAVLGMMSSETGFDFSAKIDACGGILWIWHRKATPKNEGLLRMKAAQDKLRADRLPSNWKDHVEVVTRKRSKIKVSGVDETQIDPLEALASARKIITLDAAHKGIIDALRESGYSTVWIPDHHLLQTHTKALSDLMDDEEIKSKLKLKGVFKTISKGSDKGTPNCFMFPLSDGGWRVYRFSPGIVESDTWTQDRDNWTTCYFNRLPDLGTAAKALGGAELSDGGGFEFDTAEEAAEAVAVLGKKVSIPEKLKDRSTILRRNKDGRLVLRAQMAGKEEEKPGSGWTKTKKGNYWEQVVDAQAEPADKESELTRVDGIFRVLTTPNGVEAGWAIKRKNGGWKRTTNKDNAKMLLACAGYQKTEADAISSEAYFDDWTLVHLPFQPEYPGDRRWNVDAAQFKVPPSLEPGPHPHWDRILHHCGQDLTPAIKNLEWAQRANIRTGGDYLLMWIACMFRDCFAPLPYLFFYGEQNSGKSIIHESLDRCLMTRGVVKADRCLTNQNDFNGELASAVLAVVEEKDISVAGAAAYNKIKDWVTSPTISIRKMRTDSYDQPNTTHWIQCANKREACPIFPGDTRITMFFVPDLDEEIPKPLLMTKLEQEAPNFLRTIHDLTLPPIGGRLRLPVVNTANKQRAENDARDPLSRFILDECRFAQDERVLFADFYERFKGWLAPEEHYKWSKQKVSKSLPHPHLTEHGTANKLYITNLLLGPAPQPAAGEGGAS
jgi:hypothetical protein